MLRKLFQEWQINVIKNFKRNFLSIQLLVITVITIALYLVKYLLQFDFDNSEVKDIAIMDWALAPLTFLLLMLFTSKKNVMTYAIYLAIAKVLSILFWIIGHDLTLIVDSKTSFDGLPLNSLFQGISNIMVAGNIIVEVLVVPMFLFSALVNVFEYNLVSRKTATPKSRSFWFFASVLAELVIFWAVFQYLIYPYFGTLSAELADKEIGSATVGGTKIPFMQYLQPIMAFAWFPLLFAINNTRDGNLFLGRNQELYMATQITFMIKYLSLYNGNSDLYIPVILFSVIALKMLGFVLMWARMVFTNARHFNDEGFTPITISYKKHRNKFYKHMANVNSKKKVKPTKS